jgi:hypothetical protein
MKSLCEDESHHPRTCRLSLRAAAGLVDRFRRTSAGDRVAGLHRLQPPRCPGCGRTHAGAWTVAPEETAQCLERSAQIATLSELDAALEMITDDEMTTYGLVLEEDLRHVRTFSVGEVAIGRLRVSYHGTQRTVRDNEGRAVYGGSDLVCVRGGWKVLDALPMAQAEPSSRQRRRSRAIRPCRSFAHPTSRNTAEGGRLPRMRSSIFRETIPRRAPCCDTRSRSRKVSGRLNWRTCCGCRSLFDKRTWAATAPPGQVRRRRAQADLMAKRTLRGVSARP